MAVSSTLELYLTLFGWLIYDRFWDIIVETGLFLLPFIGMFLRNIGTPVKSQETRDAANTSLRRIEIDLLVMFLVVLFVVHPSRQLGFTSLSYTSTCSNKGSVKAGATGTTYDTTFTKAMIGGQDPKVPFWWALVLSISGGFNKAAVLTIPCTTDIRMVTAKIQTSRIRNPHVRQQAKMFINDCYKEALDDFMKKSMAYPVAGVSEDDIYWMGSKYLQDKLYDKERASEIVPGFTYDKNRDLEYDSRIGIPKDGKPTCEQWWTGKGHNKGIGLRDALIDQIEVDNWTEFKQAVAKANPAYSNEEIEDIALKELLEIEKPSFNGLKDLNMYNAPSISNKFNRLAATGGSLLASAAFYPSIYMVKASAPIVQAITLMFIYMLLPFFFWFSSYDAGKVIFITIVVFSVRFWSVIWAVAHWLDNNMITSLLPSWYELALDQDSLILRMIIGFITSALFMAAPLFWSGVLGWAGYNFGRSLTEASKGLADEPKAAGGAGGNAGKSVVTKGKF